MTLSAGSLAYMQRKNKPLRRLEILSVLVDFARKHGGAIPGERESHRLFQEQARAHRYKKMAYGTFRTHMKTLREVDQLIDCEAGVNFIRESTWEPPRNLPLPRQKGRRFPRAGA